MADDFERDLEHAGNRSGAMRSTIRVTRQHPGFRSWLAACPGGDTAHDAVVRGWLGGREIRRYLGERYGSHAPERAGALAEDAFQYLADGDGGLLDTAWQHVTGTPEWQGMPRSSRLLYEIISAMSGEVKPGGLPAGPRVLACHTLVIALFMSRTGWCPSKSTITDARKPLIAAGLMDAEIGEEWTEGKLARATVYDLLPDGLREQLQQNRTMPARAGIVRLAGSSLPELTDLDRAVVKYTITLLQIARVQEIKHHELVAEIARFIEARGGPAVKLPRANMRGRVPDSPQQEAPEPGSGLDYFPEAEPGWLPEVSACGGQDQDQEAGAVVTGSFAGGEYEIDAAAEEAACEAEERRWRAAGYRIVITVPALDASLPGAILDSRTREELFTFGSVYCLHEGQKEKPAPQELEMCGCLDCAWTAYEDRTGKHLADEDRITDAAVLGDAARPPDVLAVPAAAG